MRAWCGLNGRGRAWKAGKRRGLRPCRTIAWESFPGGRLTCGSRQDGAIELGARLRCCPLLPGRCSSSAGQPRAAPRVRTTSAVSTRCTGRWCQRPSPPSPAEWLPLRQPRQAGASRPANPPAIVPGRARPPAPAGCPGPPPAAAPATSTAGLATAARAVLRRAIAGVADLASSRACPVGSSLSTIGSSLGQRHCRSVPATSLDGPGKGEDRAARMPNREVGKLHDGVPASVAPWRGACARRGRCPR
ncbi:MAG: hypothetical protein K0S88_6825 [Actinomycetia bacterium]|nr:hypothetical protein [Actinomycetes bacterium]